MSETTNAVPNPGSDAAVAKGCTCPVLDNARGRGRVYRGTVEFWIDGGCPIHGCPRDPMTSALKDHPHDQ